MVVFLSRKLIITFIHGLPQVFFLLISCFICAMRGLIKKIIEKKDHCKKRSMNDKRRKRILNLLEENT